jgi:two-component system sensor histidine kinase AtoS
MPRLLRVKRSPPEVRRQIELSTLLESMPEGVLIVDADGVVLDANTASERFLRSPRDEVRGRSVAQLTERLAIEEQGERIDFGRFAITRALAGESVKDERRTLRYGDLADPIDAIVSAHPIYSDGAIIGAFIVLRDITEVIQLQRRLSESEKHKAVGQMAAGLAHDFNNVLDTIDKAAAVIEMRRDASTEQRRNYVNLIHTAVRRGAEITGRLRQHLREGTHDAAPVRIDELLRDAVELTRPLWEEARITLRCHIENVPLVRASADDLRRVFTNLIINAIEAVPAKTGEIELRCTHVGGWVQITFADNGYGIAPEIQKKIFYPYFTTKTTGTGLGLSGAQRIVLSSGGSIRVQSDTGRGATFTIELPVMILSSSDAGRHSERRGNATNADAHGEERRSQPRAA